MIRRDFDLRSIHQLAQALAQVLHLKDRQEYEQASIEVARALREFEQSASGQPPVRELEEWITLCRKHPESAGSVMLAVADLLAEQDTLFARDGKIVESTRSRHLALGLLMEALLTEECFVTVQLVAKVDGLIENCAGSSLPPEVLRRLVRYYEVRGHFAKAEDALYLWLECADPAAAAAGRLLYERLEAMPDTALTAGEISRDEVRQGAIDWLRATQKGT